jgi:hypothetical protein
MTMRRVRDVVKVHPDQEEENKLGKTPKLDRRPCGVRKIWTFALIATPLLIALGWMFHRATIQRRSVEAIVRGGGEVYYEWEWQNGHFIPGSRSWWPRRLINMIGIDYFGSVVFVVVGESEADRKLSLVQNFTYLEGIDLSESSVSDAGLQQIEGLSRLKFVELDYTSITDTGLSHLRNLKNIECLFLENTRVSDAGMVYLKGLPRLKLLTLFNSKVTPEGLFDLRHLGLKILGPDLP